MRCSGFRGQVSGLFGQAMLSFKLDRGQVAQCDRRLESVALGGQIMQRSIDQIPDLSGGFRIGLCFVLGNGFMSVIRRSYVVVESCGDGH
jgi:hypothetical protein